VSKSPGKTIEFRESREDLAIERGPGGARSTTHTIAHGEWCGSAYRSIEPPEDWSGTTDPSRERAAAVVDRLAERDGVRVRWVSSVQRVLIVRDDGRTVEDRREGWRLRLDSGSATVEIARGGSPPNPDDPSLDACVATLADSVARRAQCRPAPAGPATVVLAPAAGGVWVHEIFGHALEGDTFARGRSWLARSDAAHLPETILICDDPKLCRAPISIDDEGTPTRLVTLIANGRVESCLHTARRASFRDPVLPRMSHTYLEAGAMSRDEILASVADGIHVRRMEAGAVDPLLGRATFRVTDADRIRRGRICEALEPHVLEIHAGLGFRGLLIGDDLSHDRSPGSCHRDGQTVITSVGAPTVCLGMVGVVR
jgi:TldD protein